MGLVYLAFIEDSTQKAPGAFFPGSLESVVVVGAAQQEVAAAAPHAPTTTTKPTDPFSFEKSVIIGFEN